jgi:hypothetical protein
MGSGVTNDAFFIEHDLMMGGPMTPRPPIHTALLVTLIAMIGLAATGRTPAAEPLTQVMQPKTFPPCDKPEALGLSRIVEIDTMGGPGFIALRRHSLRSGSTRCGIPKSPSRWPRPG